MQKSLFLLLILIAFPISNINAQEKTNPLDQDEELGTVSWYRDYDTVLALSEKKNKPILILFQEVPGCATCRNYGHNVLSNPLMTEAIENEFIPLAIFNNKKGKDLEILKKYNEPTWNNPVVRIVDSKGTNLVKRVASDYSAKGLYAAMLNALKAENREIPEYMKILGKELSINQNPNIKEAHFKMYCFWTGEKQLGSNAGVIETKAGFMNGEVVKVRYDANEISKDKLTEFAKGHQMRPVENSGNFVWAESDEDYYIKNSNFKYIPLSELQKTKINSALGYRTSAIKYLSPRQTEWLRTKKSSQDEILFDKDFEKSWNKMVTKN